MIEQGLPDQWPQPILDALERFKQGHLIEQPPLFYVGAPSFPIWSLTHSADTAMAEDLFDVHEDDRSPYGLITSQTCDLAEEGTPRQPWFQVAPVYELDPASLDDNQMQRLTNGRMLELVLLHPPTFRAEDLWVADLRIEVPIEKGWLVGRDPIEAFRAEAGYLELADRLGARRQRGAVAKSVHDSIVKPLKRQVEQMGASNRPVVLGPIHQVRLALAPDRLEPTTAQLLVVKADEISDEGHERWESWWERLRDRAEPRGLTLLGNRYPTLDELTARDFLTSVEIDLDLSV